MALTVAIGSLSSLSVSAAETDGDYLFRETFDTEDYVNKTEYGGGRGAWSTSKDGIILWSDEGGEGKISNWKVDTTHTFSFDQEIPGQMALEVTADIQTGIIDTATARIDVMNSSDGYITLVYFSEGRIYANSMAIASGYYTGVDYVSGHRYLITGTIVQAREDFLLSIYDKTDGVMLLENFRVPYKHHKKTWLRLESGFKTIRYFTSCSSKNRYFLYELSVKKPRKVWDVEESDITLTDKNGVVQSGNVVNNKISTVAINFGEAMKEETLTKDTVYIEKGEGGAKIPYTPSYADGVYTLTLAGDLEIGSQYNLVMTPEVVSAANGTILENKVYNFTAAKMVELQIEQSKKAYAQGTVIKTAELEVPQKDGCVFGGYFYDKDLTKPVGDTIEMTDNLTIYVKWQESILNDATHFAFILGYPMEDGREEVRPENNMTREEIATVFYRLITDNVLKTLATTENNFSDVAADRWSNDAISTIANGKYVNGYEDGTFKPSQPITRAEFVTIAARMYGIDENYTQEVDLVDVKGHWAEKYISFATESGWVNGYEDNTFKPNKYVTRAEVMKIINHMLNRHVQEDGLVAGAKRWEDNSQDKWYYYEVIEATNSHAFDRAEGETYETWTEVK